MRIPVRSVLLCACLLAAAAAAPAKTTEEIPTETTTHSTPDQGTFTYPQMGMDWRIRTTDSNYKEELLTTESPPDATPATEEPLPDSVIQQLADDRRVNASKDDPIETTATTTESVLFIDNNATDTTTTERATETTITSHIAKKKLTKSEHQNKKQLASTADDKENEEDLEMAAGQLSEATDEPVSYAPMNTNPPFTHRHNMNSFTMPPGGLIEDSTVFNTYTLDNGPYGNEQADMTIGTEPDIGGVTESNRNENRNDIGGTEASVGDAASELPLYIEGDDDKPTKEPEIEELTQPPPDPTTQPSPILLMNTTDPQLEKVEVTTAATEHPVIAESTPKPTTTSSTEATTTTSMPAITDMNAHEEEQITTLKPVKATEAAITKHYKSITKMRANAASATTTVRPIGLTKKPAYKANLVEDPFMPEDFQNTPPIDEQEITTIAPITTVEPPLAAQMSKHLESNQSTDKPNAQELETTTPLAKNQNPKEVTTTTESANSGDNSNDNESATEMEQLAMAAAPPVLAAEPRALQVPVAHIERIFNEDGVEVLYGYSSVVSSNRA